MTEKTSVFPKSILIFGLLAAICIAGWLSLNKNTRVAEIPQIHGVVLPEARPIEPFSLKRANGKSFTEQSLLGKWHYVFFGYTFCPDICPTTLAQMRQVYQQLKEQQLEQKVDFIFVSVDPKRDDLQRLQKYVHYFNPSFEGITGSESQLRQLASQLGVPYIVQPANAHGEYLVDHGSMIILVNPRGQYQAVFTAPHNPITMTQEFAAIDKYFGFDIS